MGIPQKLTARKFYGNHFHSITVNVPETARLFSLKSIVPEQEERTFGTLGRLSEKTLQTGNQNMLWTRLCLEFKSKPLIATIHKQLPNRIQK